LVRKSTAISAAGVPALINRWHAAATEAGAGGALGEGRFGSGRSLADQREPGHPRQCHHQRVGQADHLGRGAVVTLEPDHGRAGKTALEIEQVRGVRAGERINGLIGIANHAQVAPIAQPRIE
jgi:hypothetical protein